MKKIPDTQPKLFDDDVPSDKAKKESDDFHWRQFCRLGEMIGDGLHHEADGKWIVKEYNQLARFLIPEFREKERERRRLRSKAVDEQMQKLLLEKKCECGGMLLQSRSGSTVCCCSKCDRRYKARSKKSQS